VTTTTTTTTMMMKTVLKLNRSWTPTRPIYVTGRTHNMSPPTVDQWIMKDVYFLDLITNPACERKTVASILSTSFSDVKVIHPAESTLPVGEKLDEYCEAVKDLLQSWPGKIIIVGSPEFCSMCAKKTGQPVGDHTSRLNASVRPERRVVVRFAAYEQLSTIIIEDIISLADEVETIKDTNPLSVYRLVCEIGRKHFGLVEKRVENERSEGRVQRRRKQNNAKA